MSGWGAGLGAALGGGAGFLVGGPSGAGIGAGLGAGIGGASGGGTTSSSKQKNKMMPATPMQAYAESQLLNMLQGYNPYQQQQGFAQQTGNTLQDLLKYGMNPTPQQNTLFEGQTANYMQGLQNYLNQWQNGAMSQAQQSALARGIPLSDIARGQEANVNAQYGRQLAQGYNQAKGQELQNKLQYPMQNLQFMAGLNQQFNNPFLQSLQNIGMSRYGQPMNTTQTMTPSTLDTISKILGMGGDGGGGDTTMFA